MNTIAIAITPRTTNTQLTVSPFAKYLAGALTVTELRKELGTARDLRAGKVGNVELLRTLGRLNSSAARAAVQEIANQLWGGWDWRAHSMEDLRSSSDTAFEEERYDAYHRLRLCAGATQASEWPKETPEFDSGLEEAVKGAEGVVGAEGVREFLLARIGPA